MQNILDNIKLIVLDTDIWTGRKSLLESDLKLKKGKELPPASLASLGSKLVMDPEKLAPFHALKSAAVRAILRVGTRFLGAYAVPAEKTDEVMAEVNSIEAEFNAKKQEFMDGYQAALDYWVAANPGWENIIQSAAVSPATAAEKLKFSTQVLSIMPVAGQEQGLEKEVNGLVGQLRQEIEIMARQTWKDSFQGKTEVTQKALRPLRGMVAKIEGLAFLEPSLADLVEGLQSTFAGLPPKGMIKGQSLAAACGILSVLGNIPEAAAQEAETVEADESEEITDSADIPTVRKPVQMALPNEWF